VLPVSFCSSTASTAHDQRPAKRLPAPIRDQVANLSDAFFFCLFGFFKGEKVDSPLQSRLGKLVQSGIAPLVIILKAVEAKAASFHLVELSINKIPKSLPAISIQQ